MRDVIIECGTCGHSLWQHEGRGLNGLLCEVMDADGPCFCECFRPGRVQMVGDPSESAMVCGCDPGAEWVCAEHETEAERINADSYVEYPNADTHTVFGETRITDPTTGGQKGAKLARFDLVPPDAMWALAEHYGKGAHKYADRNWEKGYAWSLCIAALQRHFQAWLMGESYDPETGSHHLIAVAWHAFALFVFERRGLGTDDRGRIA